MRYRPDLDGLRALAVLGVFLNHSTFYRFNGGWMGVDVFFVLSGFLITRILLAEHTATGRIRLRGFYTRRVLRLYPALLLASLLGVLFYARLSGSLASYGSEALAADLYIHDFTSGFHWFLHQGLGHTWSLGVEEQFYLIWPVALIFAVSRRWDPLWMAIGGTAVSWALLAYNCRNNGPDGIPSGYYLPWDRFGELLVGCGVASFLHRRPAVRWATHRMVGWLLAFAIAAVAYKGATEFRYPNLAWQAPAIAVLTGGLLLHLDQAPSALRAGLGCKPLAYLGRRSYGFYLFSIPALGLAYDYGPSRHGKEIDALVGFLCGLALAIVSYRYVERPFLRLKSRHQPLARTAEEPRDPVLEPPRLDAASRHDEVT